MQGYGRRSEDAMQRECTNMHKTEILFPAIFVEKKY
jgi:hypothetical protein